MSRAASAGARRVAVDAHSRPRQVRHGVGEGIAEDDERRSAPHVHTEITASLPPIATMLLYCEGSSPSPSGRNRFGQKRAATTGCLWPTRSAVDVHTPRESTRRRAGSTSARSSRTACPGDHEPLEEGLLAHALERRAHPPRPPARRGLPSPTRHRIMAPVFGGARQVSPDRVPRDALDQFVWPDSRWTGQRRPRAGRAAAGAARGLR